MDKFREEFGRKGEAEKCVMSLALSDKMRMRLAMTVHVERMGEMVG